MEVYYSIGETAKLLGVTTKTLRTWDKEGTFQPDRKVDQNRLYSADQIEAKAGKPIRLLKDPVRNLTRKHVEYLTPRILRNNTFNDLTIIEKARLLEQNLAFYTHQMRRHLDKAPSVIIASPEICSMFECAMAGFAPEPWHSASMEDETSLVGVLSRRWKLYYSYHLEQGEILLATPAIFELSMDDWELAGNKFKLSVNAAHIRLGSVLLKIPSTSLFKSDFALEGETYA